MERNLCEAEVSDKNRNGFPVYAVCPEGLPYIAFRSTLTLVHADLLCGLFPAQATRWGRRSQRGREEATVPGV